MRTITATFDEQILAGLDADPEARQFGRSAVLRRLAACFLEGRRRVWKHPEPSEAPSYHGKLWPPFEGWECGWGKKLPKDHYLNRISLLDPLGREALETVTRYYLLQLEPEHQHAAADEVEEALVEIRRALDVRELAATLPAEEQDRILEVFETLLSPPKRQNAPPPRVNLVRVCLEDAAIDLACWRVQNYRHLTLGTDQLPDYERLRHGDRIIIDAPEYPDYARNGHTGKFLHYTDPRIAHQLRSAVVHRHGDPEGAVDLITPKFLRRERQSKIRPQTVRT